MPKGPSKNEDELYLVEEEEEDTVVRLGKVRPAEEPRRKVEPLRPSAPKMRRLLEEDVAVLENRKAVTDMGMEWMVEKSSTERMTTPQKRLPVGFFVLPILVVLLIGGWATWRTLQRGSEKVEISEQTVAVREAVGKSARERAAASRFERDEAAKSYENLEQVVRQYFGASEPSDFEGIIRHESRVMPLIRQYYQDRTFEPKVFKSIQEFHTISVSKRPMIGMKVNFMDGTSLPALAEDTARGVLMDWESEQAYQPVDLDTYIKERPTEPVILRVYVQPDRFYAYEFSDDTEFLSLKLTFRDHEERLNGYLKKGTVVEAELRTFMEKARNKRAPLTLRVRYPEGGQGPRSVEILEMVSQTWAVMDGGEPTNLNQ